MRLAWVTDIHLNFLDDAGMAAFCASLAAADPDALLVGGDIAEADSLEAALRRLLRAVEKPVYFVLGNHDFYGSSISAVRAAMTRLCRSETRLTYLSQAGVVKLTPRTALLGHDGWGDGRLGDYAASTVRMSDHHLIEELTGLDRAELQQRLMRLGDEAADHLGPRLSAALEAYEEVILLTHVPPFREACWYQGRTTDDNWAPFFTCQAVGDLLRETMGGRPDRRLTLLCGHTHSAGRVEILPNLLVLTGRADYGAPELQQVLDVV